MSCLKKFIMKSLSTIIEEETKHRCSLCNKKYVKMIHNACSTCRDADPYNNYEYSSLRRISKINEKRGKIIVECRDSYEIRNTNIGDGKINYKVYRCKKMFIKG